MEGTVLASRNQSAVKRAKCNAALLHGPLLVMLAALALPILLALPSGALRRPSGVVLLTAYAGYTVLALAG